MPTQKAKLKDTKTILSVAVLLLASILVISSFLIPNTILQGAGGIVAFSDGSTIDLTNSTSYIGNPLNLLQGSNGPGFSSNKQLSGSTGPGFQAPRRRNILCLVGQLCSSIDVSSYVGFNLGSLTFMVVSWYMALGTVFSGLLLLMIVAILPFGKRKRRR